MSVKHKDLKKVVKELEGAVKAHGKQAKTIDQHITDMGSGFKMRTPFRCWKTGGPGDQGYVQRGMKKKGDRTVPNCVPKASVKK